MIFTPRDAVAPRDEPLLTTFPAYEPSVVGAPVSSYDLIAIGPFVVAAVVVAGVRKMRRPRD